MSEKDFHLERRKYIIGGVAVMVILLYILRLFSLQLMSEDYKKNADSNAFLKTVQFPARGTISDRTGKLLVYNEPSYDIMVVTSEAEGVDTLDLCKSLGITPEWFEERMEAIKDRKKNPGYSSYTQQIFMSQLSPAEYSVFQEKRFRFPGFYIQKRTVRQYAGTHAAHILGDVGEVGPQDLEDDEYYQSGDYIGKMGVERSYEKELRGIKGTKIQLRDARGRVKGSYQNGKFDEAPIPGKNLTLSIDIELQALGERLMEGKLGSIVAIEPATGEILCLVSSPTYDPHLMLGKDRGKNNVALSKNPMKPLLNRAISGRYPPGSTFKTSQALTFLEEGIISPGTSYSCVGGFKHKGQKVGCHKHASPLALSPAIATSCNGYFCWGLYYMLGNKKYGSRQNAMSRWRDYMVSMGFGYKLGVDLPGENRGMIPNADYYDEHIKGWNPLSVISIAIGQGEVCLTPLQIANLGATIANRGYYITPHVVKEVQGDPLNPLYTEKHETMVSAANYNYVVNGMRQAVTSGTCKSADTKMYEVCGKTGTAQNRGHDHSVFMGFAPKNKPKIAVSVYVENGGFGAAFAVPMGALIMEQYINGKLSEDSKAKARDYQRRRISYGGER